MDILTTAFATKTATKSPLWESQSIWYPEGEFELMIELTDAAVTLDEIANEEFADDAFEHLAFSCDVAAPFGQFFVDYKHAHPAEKIPDEVIRTFLKEKATSPVPVDAPREQAFLQ